MNNLGLATMVFIVPEPFERALKLIRSALNKEDLEILLEMDVSRRLRQKLGIGLGQCKVLCVDSAASTVEAMSADPGAGMFLPARLVVSCCQGLTQIDLLNPASVQGSALPVGVKIPITRLLTRMIQTIEKVAMRKVASHIGT